MWRPIALTLFAGLLLVGCYHQNPYLVQNPEPPTYADYMKERRIAFDTMWRVIDRYAMVRWADRSTGEIEAELMMSNDLFYKTRKLIVARLVRSTHANKLHHDIEIRVLYQIETAEPTSVVYDGIVPYDWETVSSDPFMEVRLLNEVKLAMTDNAYLYDYDYRDLPFPRLEDPAGAPAPAADDGGLDTATPAVGLTADDYVAVGLRRFGVERFDEAAQAFRQAVALSSDALGPHLLLAMSHIAQQNYAPARRILETAVVRFPDWDRSGALLQQLYSGQQAMQMAHMDALEAAAAQSADALSVLGHLAYLNGDMELARRSFTDLQQRESTPATDHMLRLIEVRAGRRELVVY